MFMRKGEGDDNRPRRVIEHYNEKSHMAHADFTHNPPALAPAEAASGTRLAIPYPAHTMDLHTFALREYIFTQPSGKV